MTRKYVLDERGEPRYEPDYLEWAKWFAVADRTIARTDINGLRVLTIFLGREEGSWFFETSVFRGESLISIRANEHYASRSEAIKGHARVVDWAKRL